MIRKGQSQLVAVLSSQSARHRSRPPAESSNSSSVTLLAQEIVGAWREPSPAQLLCEIFTWRRTSTSRRKDSPSLSCVKPEKKPHFTE
ncbi:hypothetical protein KOW79_005723 [Hemibagrus wyckioides]|uniref:Uncharacterized protein n=1 Tax=Hemibagrus wyckioides TaxID=337641 RepID=A0A9D3P0Y4_9TELE|nr:hypothetical protein KOW79_005723 [Hemibagrus wyckioides]